RADGGGERGVRHGAQGPVAVAAPPAHRRSVRPDGDQQPDGDAPAQDERRAAAARGGRACHRERAGHRPGGRADGEPRARDGPIAGGPDARLEPRARDHVPLLHTRSDGARAGRSRRAARRRGCGGRRAQSPVSDVRTRVAGAGAAVLAALLVAPVPAAAQAREAWRSEDGESALQLRAVVKAIATAIRSQPGLVDATDALRALFDAARQAYPALQPIEAAAVPEGGARAANTACAVG